MTTKRKRKTTKKAVRKSGTRRKPKSATPSPARKREAPQEPTDDGFVILLDDPEPSDATTEGAEVGKRVRLRSDCTIEKIAGIQQRLLNSFDGTMPLTIDLGAVEKVDTAFLQLLCSLVSEANNRGVALRWEKPSKSFAEASVILGVDEQFRSGQ